MTPQEFKQEQGQNLHETSPDKILDGIKGKINLSELEDWKIREIIGLLEKDKINVAVGKMSEFFDLEDKELEHLRELPVKIILKLFVKKEIQEE